VKAGLTPHQTNVWWKPDSWLLAILTAAETSPFGNAEMASNWQIGAAS